MVKAAMATKKQENLTICGLLNDITFHVLRCSAQDLHEQKVDIFPEPEVRGMLEFEWDQYIEEQRRRLKDETWAFNKKAITFCNDVLIGGPTEFAQWAEENYNYEDFRPQTLYETLTQEAYVNYLNSQKHDHVYLDITIGDKAAGKLVIELFTDIVPKTCENFKLLCTGEKGSSYHEDEDVEYKLHYENSIFHRIVKNGWIQGGDIWKGRGNGGESVYGPVFEDENFAVKHNKRGILSMSNNGRHTNGSQFHITLQPTPWMNTKYVAFGQIIEGTETLKRIEEQETVNERPTTDVKISGCGVLTYTF
ncbi:unnamed protein product [Owenia fusiformis]|uniref:Uncharacterized protein n=1 Tax=Owenia fusiformis TaxID=6347 RepID=A0A8J1XIE0_OWEFU|nr:unnamed protein product [Owenia fusiformis]